MKVLDSVILLQDFNGMPSGTKGCVMDVYDDTTCEAEFIDKDGKTLLEDMTCSVPIALLRVIWHCPTCGDTDCKHWKGPREI